MVEFASLLFVDPVDYCNELAVVVPLAILLSLLSSVVVLGLVHGFSLSLTLVLLEYCTDGLLTGGVTYREVEQLSHRSRFVAPELVDECFIGRARDERSDHACIHNVGKLVALLEKAADVLV